MPRDAVSRAANVGTWLRKLGHVSSCCGYYDSSRLSKGWAKIRRERDAKIVKQPTTNYELPTTNYELYLSMREQTIHTMKRHVA